MSVFTSTDKKTMKFKFHSIEIPKDLQSLPFGRQIDSLKLIQKWQEKATKGYISQKRQSFTKALKEFIDLYQPDEYFIHAFDKSKNPTYYDDCPEIYYTKKEQPTQTITQ